MDMYALTCFHAVYQDPMAWVPGSRPVNSIVPPPANHTSKKSPFNRSEFEVFAHHTVGATGDKHGDRLLEWASNPQYKASRIRYSKMKTMGKKAIDLNIPGGVMSRDFTEPADGSQRLVFFFRSLYDAVKQLASNTRFAGKQYTEFEMVHTVGNKRKYGAINRGEMYESAQARAGADTSPMPVFLSSDTTVICKKMGTHPIICESACCMQVYVYVCIVLYHVCICMYDTCIVLYLYVSVCINSHVNDLAKIAKSNKCISVCIMIVCVCMCMYHA